MKAFANRLLSVAAVGLLTAACEATKTSNPLSPTVAGPIPGVNISAPRLLQPGAGTQIDSTQQPLTLVVENASTNGQRPLSYTFEIATDAGFSTKVFTREGVAQGDGGRTSLRLPDPLQGGRMYYWRAKADDGLNHGPFSGGAHFDVFTPVTIDPPALLSPGDGSQLGSVRPTFKVRNSARSGPAGSVTYTLEVAPEVSFSGPYVIVQTPEQPNETTIAPVVDLPFDRAVFWRVRAREANGKESEWSRVQHFLTPNAPPPPPPPPTPGPPAPVPLPPGGGGGGGGGSCISNNGEFIVQCVGRKYPQYLAAGVSLDQRKANMAFLRDRIIEAGKCGGMDLGRNLKRGGPELSIDFLAWRQGNENIGVDLGFDYDNTSQPLRLTWAIHGPGAFYSAYSMGSCNGI